MKRTKTDRHDVGQETRKRGTGRFARTEVWVEQVCGHCGVAEVMVLLGAAGTPCCDACWKKIWSRIGGETS